MPLYVVADGGGTKTKFRLIDENKNCLSSREALGSNPIYIGTEQTVRSVRDQVYQLLSQGGVSPEKVCSAVLFIPVLWRMKGIFDEIFPFKTEVLSDTVAAYWAALEGQDGVVVSSGTGSFALGRYKEQYSLVGGWGPYIGDPGSGHAIGMAALRHMAVCFDRGMPLEPLCEAVKEKLEIRSPDDLKWLQRDKERFTPARVAGLCPVVERLAAMGDKTAVEILHKTAKELADQGRTCIQRLFIPEQRKFKIALTGGVIMNNETIRSFCITEMRSKFGNAEVFCSEREPIEGAEDYAVMNFNRCVN